MCENCEEVAEHQHPLIKIRQPMKGGFHSSWEQNSQNFFSGGFPQIKEYVSNYIKEIIKKKYKVKALKNHHNKELAVLAGSIVNLRWDLVNKGRNSWPAESRFVLVKGNFSADDIILSEVAPGETVHVEVKAKVPNDVKACSGKWKIVIGEKEFGKIKVNAEIVDDPNVRTLSNMGFSVENARKTLSKVNGDINLAISQILKN